MKHIALLFLALAGLCLSSCKDDIYTPEASGRPYEVMVVMDSTDWQEPHGRALFNVLDSDVPGLPQSEAAFKISRCNVNSFDHAIKFFRNIILVDISRSLHYEPGMKFTRNKWAKNQIVLTIYSPDKESFRKYCEENKKMITDFLTRSEMNRLVQELGKKHSKTVEGLAKDMFGCQLWAPSEIGSEKKGKDFFWTSNNTASGMVNICMYSYPYEGAATMNKEYVIRKRDSVMKANIPGPEDNMYMTTDTSHTEVQNISVHGKYCLETRGLWCVENYAMGGPFVSHTRIDTIKKRVIVAEGFVYAPEKMKRGLIRRLEGSLYSLLLPQEKDLEIETGVAEEKENKKEEDD